MVSIWCEAAIGKEYDNERIGEYEKKRSASRIYHDAGGRKSGILFE